MEENFCLEVTTICDANCIMCPRDEYPYRFKTMDFETFKLCVSRLKEHFSFTGGGADHRLWGLWRYFYV